MSDQSSDSGIAGGPIVYDNTHYASAPIVEAVIELSVERKEPITVSELEKVVIADKDFLKRKDLIAATGHMTLGTNVTASASTNHIGFQYLREDEKIVLHIRVDGFAVSRLPPYTNWDDFYATFSHYWERYEQVVKPEFVTKLGVRYVNRFDLPGEVIELRDYFRTYPEVSSDIQFPMNGFMTHLQIDQADIGAIANIVLAAQPPVKDGHLSILLDIGLTKPIGKSKDRPDIHESMSILRKRKNELFEACIKPAARDLIRESRP